MIAKGWVQGVALVMMFGFLVMGILAYRTYTASVPLPDKVVTQAGQLLFTKDDVTRGQEIYPPARRHHHAFSQASRRGTRDCQLDERATLSQLNVGFG